MRVISGRFKGFALPQAKPGTRPTTDRTKEAIFSRLDARGAFDDTRVLDLFAGTGALGVEALSRGARELVSVESAGAAGGVLSRTLSSLQHQQSWKSGMVAQVRRQKAERFAESYHGPAFDVIFADPPYAFETSACDALMAALVGAGAADGDTMMIIERSTRSAPLTPPEGWEISERRDYGETAVYFIECAIHHNTSR